MNAFVVIAISEVKTLFKERVFFLLLAVFVSMTLMSSFIGWSTYTTTDAVYHASVMFLGQHGVTQVPANPIASFPVLASFRNVIIYMFLIGSLMAIVLGNRSFIRERKSGVLSLILSRPISPATLLLGKIAGIFLALLSVIGVTAVISIISAYFLPLQHLSFQEGIKLVVFYGYSLLYLMLFALLGLFFAIVAKSESLALFIPVCIWVAVSFVMPELITGQTATALLNPVTIDTVVSQGWFFSFTQQFLVPISLGWHFTSLSSQLLNATVDTRSVWEIVSLSRNTIFTLLIALTVTFLLSYSALQKYDVQNDVVNE